MAGPPAVRPQPRGALQHLCSSRHRQSYLASGSPRAARPPPDPDGPTAGGLPRPGRGGGTGRPLRCPPHGGRFAPPRLQAVILTHYGLGGSPPQTLAAIGRALGISRERVRQLRDEALLLLAHPARSLLLRQLVGRNTVADYRAYFARQRRFLRRRRGR